MKDVTGIEDARSYAREHLDVYLVREYAVDPASYWEAAEIMHYPPYIFEETLATFRDLAGGRNTLHADAEWLAKEIAHGVEIKLKRFDELLRQRYLHRFKVRNLEQAAVDEVLALPASEGLTRLGRLASGWLNDPPIDRWPLESEQPSATAYSHQGWKGKAPGDSALKALEGMARVLQGVMSASPPNDRVREAYWKCLHRTGDLCIAMGDLSRAHAGIFRLVAVCRGASATLRGNLAAGTEGHLSAGTS